MTTYCTHYLRRNHIYKFRVAVFSTYTQGDQNVSVHMMFTTQKATSNIQSFPRQSPAIY
jgi:hypothetical protein